MSYRFTVPAVTDSSRAYCTAETFDQTAEDVLTAYLSTWADDDQRKATRRAADQALEAVACLVEQPSIVGDTFVVTIAGHANPEPGKPDGNWGPDFVTIDLRSVPVADSPPTSTAAPAPTNPE